VNVQSTQTEAWNLCTPLFEQFIHNELLEWSISEPNVSATGRMRSLFNIVRPYVRYYVIFSDYVRRVRILYFAVRWPHYMMKIN